MFGNLGNMMNLLKQAGQMREQMARMQEELTKKRYEADSGAGMVRATVNGRAELVDIKIAPSAVHDVELLEDLIKSAVASAAPRAVAHQPLRRGRRAEVPTLASIDPGGYSLVLCSARHIG